MTATLHAPTRPPLLSSTQAEQLLDEVIYERVLAMVDLDALWKLEQELWFELDGIEGVDEDRIPELSKAMVDRALARLVGEPRRYMKVGQPADDDDDEDEDECAACHFSVDAAKAEESARRDRSAALLRTPSRETS
ncbi:MAG: hypothetical protein H0T79_01330 [Deltaproteobacteria bacterium]|nr:hypothetical protein [Deltaproteobacteria bacterium]